MDEPQATIYLRMYFPEKPVDYLQSMYRKYNKDINSTIYAIAKSKTQKDNVLNGVSNSAQKLLCGSKKTKEVHKESLSSQTEEFFKIDIGDSFAKALTEKFADPSLKLPHGFKPIIEIPVTFGRQIFIAYIESIYQQGKEQTEHLNHLTKNQNKKLKTKSNEMTAELEQNVSEALPMPSDIKHPIAQPSTEISHENMENASSKVNKSNQESRTIIKLRLQAEEQRHQELMQSPLYLREIARQHKEKQQHLLDIARKAEKSNNQELADEYFEQAKLQALLSQRVNNIAAEAILKENRQQHPSENTIDLRHLEIRNAIQTFDIFVDDEINSLCNSTKNNKDLMIITGREGFSVDGSLKIKPSVIKRLGTRHLR